MSRRSTRFLSGASLLLSLGACDKLTNVSGGGTPVMLVTLGARTKTTGYSTSPVSNFYRVGSATFSSALAATDSCRSIGYDPGTPAPTVLATSIGGGAFVAVRVPGRTDTLRKVSTTDLTYRLASLAGMDFTPGDSITFVVAGDVTGFPAVTLTGRTAEAFTLSPVVVPGSPGSPLALKWSAPADPNAAMLVSLRYNNGTGAGLNAQILCDFRDRGEGTVPAALTVLWSGSNTREIFAERLRTALVRVPGATDSYFNMISTFDIPTPVSP